MWNILEEDKRESQQTEKKDRVQQAKAKKKDKSYEPTWAEVWHTGYTRPTGTFKQGIFQTKMQGNEEERLQKVLEAIESGELTVDRPNSKISKKYALELYSELLDRKRDKEVKRMKEEKPSNYYTVTNSETLKAFARLMDNEEIVVLDTETTGVTDDDVTVGFSATLPKADVHFYVPYLHTPPEKDEQIPKEIVMHIVKPHLEREGLKLVGANFRFDVHKLQKDGIDILHNFYFDVQVAMKVLNENEPTYKLKKLIDKYGKFFGYEDKSYTFEELFGKNPIHFITGDLEVGAIYACKDTHVTYLLYKWILDMFEQRPQLKSYYFNIEQPQHIVSTYMERMGMMLDLPEAKRYKQELEEKIQSIRDEIAKEFGEVNLNSPQQLQEALYEKKGIKPITKKMSTDKNTLDKLSKENPEVQLILDYRDLNKVYSTYIKPLPEKVRDTGRVHGSFNQSGTVTGRYSSNEPNLQNIPEDARGIFLAPKGKVMIGIDYSQIEPRTLAHISDDKDLQKPYQDDTDFYAFLASRVFDLPYEACLENDDKTWREQTNLKKHPRKMMKVGMLAVMYGISNYGLSDSLGIKEEEAEEFINDFYKMFPRTADWMSEIHEEVFKNKYVTSMHGRKRRFPDAHETLKLYKMYNKKLMNKLGYIPDNVWEVKGLKYDFKKQYQKVLSRYESIKRQSVNFIIQGSASEVLKMAMYEAYQYIKDKEGWKMIATIHDEVLYEIPEDATPEEIAGLEDAMKGVVTFRVPIDVDTEVMVKWSEKVDLDDWIEQGRGRNIFQEAE